MRFFKNIFLLLSKLNTIQLKNVTVYLKIYQNEGIIFVFIYLFPMNVHLVTGFTRYRKSSFSHFMTSSSRKHLLDEDACQNGKSVHDSASKETLFMTPGNFYSV